MTAQSVEMKPGGQVMTEVFLSPRVVDGRAFDTFSGALKALIERAAEQTAALADAATRAERAQRALDAEATSLEERVAALRTSLELATAQSEEARRSMGAVEEASLRLRTLEIATRRGIEDAQNRLADVERATGARLREALADAAGKIDELESRLNRLESRAARLSLDGPGGLRALCERAEALLRPDAAGAEGESSLEAALRRGERMIAWVKRAATDLDQLREQGHEVRRLLGETVLAAADAADRIESVIPAPAALVPPPAPTPAPPPAPGAPRPAFRPPTR